MISTLLQDGLAAPVWVFANGCLLRAHWRLGRKLFGDDGPEELAAQVTVGAWASVAGSALVLGTMGVLTAPLLLGVVLAVSQGILLFCRFRGAEVDSGVGRELGLLSFAVAFFPACFLTTCAISGELWSFPREWDTLMYHLPRVDQWLIRHSLYVDHSYNWSHPGNNELIALWLVAPFSGDFLAALNNVPAVLLLGFGSVLLGRSLGLSRGLARLTALAILGNAVVFWHLGNSKNDVAVTGLLLASFAHGIRYARGKRVGDLVWGGLSLGLLTGSKYNGFVYAGWALLIVASIVFANQGPKSAAWVVGIWVACTLFWGGSWYLRNVVMAGSPLYPVGLRPEADVLSRIYPDIKRSSFWGCGQDLSTLVTLAMSAVKNSTGYGHMAAIVLLPLTLLGLAIDALAVRGRRGSALDRAIRLAVVSGVLGCGAILMVTPFAVEDIPGTMNQLKSGTAPVRFGLPFLSLAVVAFSMALNDRVNGVIGWLDRQQFVLPATDSQRTMISLAAKRVAYIPVVVWGIVVLHQFASQARHQVEDPLSTTLVALIVLEGFGMVRVCYNSLSRHRCTALIVSALVVLAASAWGSCRLSDHWHRNYASHYGRVFETEIFRHLETSSPRSSRLCVLFYRSYPFNGSSRQFDVFVPMWMPTEARFERYLERNRIGSVVVPKGLNRFEGWNTHAFLETETRFRHEATASYSDDFGRIFDVARPIRPPGRGRMGDLSSGLRHAPRPEAIGPLGGRR